ncbi:MAG: glycoside hydrolase family 28 protein [Chthoniobacteraceae bacterium]
MPQFKATLLTSLAALGLLFAPSLSAAEPKIVDVTKAGVLGDGTTLNTTSLQKAIDDLAAAGGGTLEFPAGRYLTGTVQLKSNLTLQLDEGATILGSTNAADYRNLDPFIDGSGNPMGHALIVAVEARHVAIEGKGTIDGQGKVLASHQKPFSMRPFLIRWVRCSDIAVRGVHLTNPGAWTLHFSQSKNAVVDGLTIRTRDQRLRNNDGVDIDSSENIHVTNCDIISGDDAIVIKSTSGTPSRDIVASDCRLSTRTNAIKLGTESYGGFENITVSRCTVTNTDMAGIALYEVDGASLSKVNISDVTMDGVSVPISIRLGARLKTFRAGDQPKPASTLSDVTIKNVTAKNVKVVGILINGIPGHPVENVTLENVQLEVPGGGTAEDAKIQLPEKEKAYPEFSMFGKKIPASGIYIRHVKGLTFKDVKVTPLQPDARPATVVIDAENVTPADLASH